MNLRTSPRPTNPNLGQSNRTRPPNPKIETEGLKDPAEFESNLELKRSEIYREKIRGVVGGVRSKSKFNAGCGRVRVFQFCFTG